MLSHQPDGPACFPISSRRPLRELMTAPDAPGSTIVGRLDSQVVGPQRASGGRLDGLEDRQQKTPRSGPQVIPTRGADATFTAKHEAANVGRGGYAPAFRIAQR